MKTDDIDRQILIKLQQNGRKTASKIAKELNLTSSYHYRKNSKTEGKLGYSSLSGGN